MWIHRMVVGLRASSLWVERSADQTSLLSELMIIGYDNPVQAR